MTHPEDDRDVSNPDVARPGGDASPAGFTCPRCGAEDATSRFYGPCGSCRDELALTMGGVRRDLKVEAYAPKMNVVPNHIATKE